MYDSAYTSMPTSLDKTKAVGISYHPSRHAVEQGREEWPLRLTTGYDAIAANMGRAGCPLSGFCAVGHLTMVVLRDGYRSCGLRQILPQLLNLRGAMLRPTEIWNEPNGVQFGKSKIPSITPSY